ncbi:hypothetical protein Cci01nite_21060 [Catellatospora citrea]|uniref:Uncharacterized protein n=1 Tax=Catellatospora citrea TaxID=53366 RepID=A0A8J3KCA8_9ACTN|nr:hypothetical protein Cci01nite_21060 [Catellatospora citrea]
MCSFPRLSNYLQASGLLRRGTPDAGIEFSCAAPDGKGVWAWQAKCTFGPTVPGRPNGRIRNCASRSPPTICLV